MSQFMRRDRCPILFTRPMSRHMWPMSLRTVLALESMMQEMQDVPNKVEVMKENSNFDNCKNGNIFYVMQSR